MTISLWQQQKFGVQFVFLILADENFASYKPNARVQTQFYAEILQFSLKEDLVNNGYSLFAEEVISKPQYAEEFIKDDRAFSLLHQELPQILVLCFP